jgi:hypothetical protein
MPGLLWRLLFAAICVVLLFNLIGPFCALVGFTLDPNLNTIIRVCVGGLAVFYVVWGSSVPPWRST